MPSVIKAHIGLTTNMIVDVSIRNARVVFFGSARLSNETPYPPRDLSRGSVPGLPPE